MNVLLECEFFHLSLLRNPIIMIKVTSALTVTERRSKSRVYFPRNCLLFHSNLISELQLLRLTYNSLNNLITHHLSTTVSKGQVYKVKHSASMFAHVYRYQRAKIGTAVCYLSFKPTQSSLSVCPFYGQITLNCVCVCTLLPIC